MDILFKLIGLCMIVAFLFAVGAVAFLAIGEKPWEEKEEKPWDWDKY